MRHFLLFISLFLIHSTLCAQEKKRGGYDFHLAKAYEYYNQQEYEEAKESVSSALRSKRNDAEVFILRANIAIAESNQIEAIKYLKKASRIGSAEADQMLTELNSEPWRTLDQAEVEVLNNDIETYLERNELKEKEKKDKKDKKTKTR